MPETNRLGLCIISPAIYPLFNPQIHSPFDDAEIQLYELARYFGNDERIDVSIVTGDYGQQEIENYSGTMVYRSHFDVSSRFLQRLFKRGNALTHLLEKIDAQTYLMAGASSLTKEVAEFCKAKRKGFVFRTAHQRDCDGTFVHAGGEDGEKYRWALHRAHTILCQTEKQKELLHRTEQLNVLVLPNVLPQESKPGGEQQEALWIGEAVEWRQPELFFRLALTLPNHTFTMIARPRDEAYFERLVSKTRDVPNLGFENSVPCQEWPSYFNRAKLLVNTSRFEGFPFTFSQALSHGVPIASLNVNPDSILDKKQLGFCANGSEVRLAQGVLDLLSYDRQWSRMSENALNYSLDNQDIESQSQEYRKLFIRCANKSKRRRIGLPKRK